jgi:hypothetical protein
MEIKTRHFKIFDGIQPAPMAKLIDYQARMLNGAHGLRGIKHGPLKLEMGQDGDDFAKARITVRCSCAVYKVPRILNKKHYRYGRNFNRPQRFAAGYYSRACRPAAL